MKKNFLPCIACLILITFTLTCSKPNQPYHKPLFLIQQLEFPTLGYPLSFDVSDEYLFVAEDAFGFSIFNQSNAQLVQRLSNAVYLNASLNEINVKFNNASFIKFIPELDFLMLVNNADMKLFSTSFKNPQQPITTVNYLNFSANIYDIQYEIIPNNQEHFFAFWGSIESNNQKFFKNLVFTNPEPYEDYEPITNIEVPNEIRTIIKHQNYYFLAMGKSAIYIVANDQELSLIADIYPNGEALSLQVYEQYLYVASRHAGLQIIDISDITNPIKLDNYSINTVGLAKSLDIYQNYLALVTSTGGIHLFDLSQPEQPKLLERLVKPNDFYYQVRFFNGELFVSSRSQGIVKYSLK